MKKLITIAFRSILYRRKQFLSLFLVCALGTALSFFAIFAVNGMLSSMQGKAAIYYGGDFQFLCGRYGIFYPELTQNLESLEQILPSEAVVSTRVDIELKNSAFYFEGLGVRQRIIKGVDFEKEKMLFSGVNFVSGGTDDVNSDGGAIISKPIADMLGVTAGDEVTFMFYNNKGQRDTVELKISGVFVDSSIFGLYTSYVDAQYLRKIMKLPGGYVNRICINFPKDSSLRLQDGSITPKQAQLWYEELSSQWNMFRYTHNKQDFYNAMMAPVENQLLYALIPLDANMKELKIVIDAMKLISMLIALILNVIIVVGVASNYRVIATKRTDEFGIYKSMGMTKARIYLLILTEASVLLITSVLIGLALSRGIFDALGFVNWSAIPNFDVFLTNGKLVAGYSWTGFLLVGFSVIITTLIFVLLAVGKAVKITPVQALNRAV